MMITAPSRQATAEHVIIDEERLNRLLSRAVVEVCTVSDATLVAVGEQLGLYRMMAGAGPLTPAELARRTNTVESYIRGWLDAQAAGGHVDHETASGRYSLSPGQVLLRADEDSPATMAGAFYLPAS